jgi:hypothetical protein
MKAEDRHAIGVTIFCVSNHSAVCQPHCLFHLFHRATSDAAPLNLRQQRQS